MFVLMLFMTKGIVINYNGMMEEVIMTLVLVLLLLMIFGIIFIHILLQQVQMIGMLIMIMDYCWMVVLALRQVQG